MRSQYGIPQEPLGLRSTGGINCLYLGTASIEFSVVPSLTILIGIVDEHFIPKDESVKNEEFSPHQFAINDKSIKVMGQEGGFDAAVDGLAGGLSYAIEKAKLPILFADEEPVSVMLLLEAIGG
jgi:hypothetical protein